MSMNAPVSNGSESSSAHPKPLLDVRVLFLIIIIASVAFLGGVLYSNSTDSPHDNQDFKVFWEGWDILDQDYYYQMPENTSLVYGALQGLFASVGDQYTFFDPPTKAEYARQVTAGEFGGIGAYVTQNSDGQVEIVSPFPDFPADQAGLKAGDVILEVDGTSIQGMSLTDALSLLRGEVGTQMSLTIDRPSDGTQFTVQVTRAVVEMPIINSHMFGDVGYVRLYIFNEKAVQSVQNEVQQMLDQGAQALILDLRGNPGGLLDQAVGIGDLFLNAGVVVTQRNRNGQEIVYRSKDGDLAENVPVIVLIDENSASASEVVAGALRDRGRAVLVGRTSFGKGSVQYVHDLPDGSQVHVTTALWFTPDDIAIQGKGLTPDVSVKDQESANLDQDPFIVAALAYIKDNLLTESPSATPGTGISDGNQS